MSLLAVLLAAAAVAVGCEDRAQESPAPEAPGAELSATAGHGAEELLETRVEPGQSAMRAIRGATDVETGHGGGFVQEMLGRASDADGARDWYFFVNGLSPPVGAQEVELSEGDVVWWDYRSWRHLPTTPAVIGSWPAPFVHPGDAGPDAVSADPPLDEAVRDAGGQVVEADSPWRVRVGAHEDLVADDPAWRDATQDPDAAGLTVSVRDGRIVALDAESGERTPVEGARALIAAVPTGDDPADGVLLAVAGLDAESARTAAERLAEDPELVRGAYALALDGDGEPLRAGGRPER